MNKEVILVIKIRIPLKFVHSLISNISVLPFRASIIDISVEE